MAGSLMDRRPLGRTGIEISPIGFGGSPLGGVFGDIDDQSARDAVHTAFRYGINWFDTSPFYGVTKSETNLGKALVGLPRQDIVVASKVGRYDQDKFDFSAERVKASVNESLERLQLDYLDIVQCHDIEFGNLDQIVNETVPALQELKDAGKVRAIGITGYPLDIYSYVLDRSKVQLDVVLSYCHNCLNDTSLRDMVPYLKEKGVGVVNASVLCMGLLTPTGPPEWHPAPQELKDAAKKANELVVSRGENLPKLAQQYALADTSMTSTLIGMKSVQEVEACVQNVSAKIDQELLNDVLEIFKPVHNMTWPSGN